MAVSPKAYETVGKALGLSAQKLTEEVGKALTKLHQEVILDPSSIGKARKRYNTSINKALKEWNKRWKDWADRDLAEAYLRGTEYTDEEIKRLKLKRNPDGTVSPDQPLTTKYPKAPSGGKIPSSTKQVLNPIPHHLTFYNVFRRAAHHSLEGTHLQILRASKDLYRDVAVQAGDKMFKESDIFTRRQLSQEMLGDFAKRGINCITYKNGRRVSIEAYAEMVGRTMSAHAAVQASLNRFEEYGYNLVRVSSHFRACPLCVPWEGKILRTKGGGDN